MGNPIIENFKMRRHGGKADRASEVSPTSYSVNQERTMAQMGMVDQGMNYGTEKVGMNYGTPILRTDPDDFVYGDDANVDYVLTPPKNMETFTGTREVGQPASGGGVGKDRGRQVYDGTVTKSIPSQKGNPMNTGKGFNVVRGGAQSRQMTQKEKAEQKEELRSGMNK